MSVDLTAEALETRVEDVVTRIQSATFTGTGPGRIRVGDGDVTIHEQQHELQEHPERGARERTHPVL